MTVDASRVKAIFLEAVDKTSANERAAVLDRECGLDTGLRERVESLLRSHDTSASVLDRPAAEQFSVSGSTALDGTVMMPTPDAALEPTSIATSGDDELLKHFEPSSKPGSLGRLAHYEMMEILGRGGFGTVFKSFDEKLHRIVAIKILAPSLAASGNARQRFLREARAAAAVRDEHVIAIYSVDEQPLPFLVMEYIEGQTLEQKLTRTGPLPTKEILRIGYQVASGLAAAHRQGFLHRDIKPSNILLENGVERVKLSDFGLARMLDDASLTQSGLIAGTPLFMSPEQAEAKPVDKRSDLFSLGSVLYALCTGHPPFRAATTLGVLKRVCEDTPRPIREINAEIPDSVAEVVNKLLAKNPNDRFPSAKEVADVLARYLSDLQLHGKVLTETPLAMAMPKTPARPSGEATELVAPKPRVSWLPYLVVAAFAGCALVAMTGYAFRALWFRSGSGQPVNADPGKPGSAANPLDARSRNDIEPALLSFVGDGDVERAPEELVAVLGNAAFNFTGKRLGDIAVSPAGSLLAVPADGQVYLFDAKTGRLVRKFVAHGQDGINRLAFSSDGKLLVTCSNDRTAKVWDVATGNLEKTFTGHGHWVLNAIFGPENKTVISSSADGTARIWEVSTGEQLYMLPHRDHVHGLSLSPDGKWLATGCNDRLARVWDVATGTLQHTLEGHSNQVTCICFSPDGKWLVTGAREAKIWDASTFKLIHTLPGTSHWLAFDPKSATLYASSVELEKNEVHVVRRWDVASGEKRPDLTMKNPGSWAVFALTPDAKTLFMARSGPVSEGFVRAYDTQTGIEKFAPRMGHTGLVWCVTFSPDGRLLASGGDDNTVRVWNLAGWRAGEPQPPVRVLGGHAMLVWTVKFSPDDKLLAASSIDRSIILWDAVTGKKVRTLKNGSNSFSRFAFAPDGQTIAAGMEDGSIRFWDVATGQEKSTLDGHVGVVRCVAYSPDGKLLATAGVDKTVQIFDTDNDQLVKKFTLPNIIDNVAFSPDGKRLAATTDFNDPSTLNFWDVSDWKQITYPSHYSHVPGLAWSPTEPLLATSSYDRTVRLWDLRETPPRIRTVGGPAFFGGGPAEVAFAPDGRYLATANHNGTLTIMKVPALPSPYQPGPAAKSVAAQGPSAADKLDSTAIPADLLKQAGRGDAAKAPAGLVAILGGPDGHSGQVFSVAASPDGKTLASVSLDKSVRLWDLSTGQLLLACSGHTGPVFAVTFSPDGKSIVSGAEDGTVRFWDAATGHEQRTLIHGAQVRQAAFTPDGKLLATIAGYSGAKLWDARTGQLLRTFWPGGEFCACLAISPDGKSLVTGHENGIVRIWDIATGWQLASIGPTPGIVRSVVFTPDAQSLIIGATESLGIWDLATLKLKQKLEGHRGEVLSCAVRGDGLIASVGGVDNTLRLWQPGKSTSRESRLFPPDTKWLHGVAFTPDGRYLATANPDGTIYVLSVSKLIKN